MEKHTLVFATGNEHKVIEIRSLLENLPYHVVPMAELGYNDEIPETGETLEENAVIKAKYLYEKLRKDIISEDTGLEVEALEGEPGVRTARYAGDSKDPIANMELLLSNLANSDNRRARFRTVIALYEADGIKTFEGIVNGTIARKKMGSLGFGYDPIFIPEGFQTTFAQMEMKEKSSMSHRGRALGKLLDYLQSKV